MPERNYSLEIVHTRQFEKDYRRLIRQGKNVEELDAVITRLAARQPLEPRFRDHPLLGRYEGFRECHIRPDWLLIYAIDNAKLVLVVVRIGSHSEFF